MRYSWISLLLFSGFAGPLWAQQPFVAPNELVNPDILHQWIHSGDPRLVTWAAYFARVTDDSVASDEVPKIVTTEFLHQWLRSGDPRLIAWAAYFARKTHNRQVLSEMPEMLTHWASQRLFENNGVIDEYAVMAMLDALIHEKVPTSAPSIGAVADFFPAQAAILATRLPESESRSMLNGWAGLYGDESWNKGSLKRVATMILAQHPDPKLVAQIVSSSEAEIHVQVRATDAKWGMGQGGGIGGGTFDHGNFLGWPPLYTYVLDEEQTSKGCSSATSQLIVNLAGNCILANRTSEDRAGLSQSHVEQLDAVTRHRLIAYWLGIKPEDMSWQPENYVTIAWTNKAGYEQKLGARIEAERRKMEETIDALGERGFVFYHTVYAPPITPRIVVTVECDLNPCPLEKAR